ncbi:SDR family NAD(P)-dependent oxidoreductase [Aquimarina sp. RZ0]|uniref:SDR family NAD(P)-dependent oxidoreductase n=1 Tax=Aquimarina sp. RZ0 TaxID=2607730 RepID=UPI001CB6E8B6|nr:SDR family NAD(P)-dependent oxidoreductase [Aquimarina sp. RZ0]
MALSSVAYTLQIGRESMQERLSFIASTKDAVLEKLESYLSGSTSGLYTGNTRDNASEFLLQDESEKSYVSTAIANKELDNLARLWASGISIDWNLLYDSVVPMKVGLPTYPFSREHYWVSETSDAFLDSSVFLNHLHPLVHQNISDLHQQCFRSVFTGKEFFFSDHQLGGKKLFPGVGYLELARESGRLSLGHLIYCFREVRLLHPFEAPEYSQELLIRLFPSSSGSASFEVYSNSGDSEVVHSEGILDTEVGANSLRFDISDLKSSYSIVLSKDEIYSKFLDLGVFYGSHFQGIERIYCGSRSSLSRVHLGLVSGYGLPLGILDSGLQSCLGVLIGSGEDIDSLLFPYSIESFHLYRDTFPEDVWVYVEVAEGAGSGSLMYDVLFLDLEGVVVCDFKGLLLLSGGGTFSSASSDMVWSSHYYYSGIWKDSLLSSSDVSNVEAVPTLIILLGVSSSLGDKLCSSLGQEVLCVTPEDSFAYFEIILNLVQERLLSLDVSQLLLVYGESDSLDYGFISGLLKSLHLESNKLRGRSLEVSDASISNFTLLETQLKQELSKDAISTEVRYRDGIRQEKFYIESSLSSMVTSSNRVSFQDEGVYLITGGMGGLGKLLGSHILSGYKKCIVVLIGRRSLSEEENSWVSSHSGMVYKQGDVTDRSFIEVLLSDIVTSYGKLNGIVHTAGVLRDSLLPEKDISNSLLVLKPKILGARYLDELSRDISLDFLVLYSSISSVLGNIGQGCYASANAWMDRYADYRNDLVSQGVCKGHTLSINWPLWSGSGMNVSQDVKTYFSRYWGLDILPEPLGLSILEDLLSTSFSQVAVIYGDGFRFYERLSGRGVLEEKSTTTIPDQTILLEKVQTTLLDLVSKLLKLESKHISINEELGYYGFDSILLTKFSNLLNEYYNLDLLPTIFYNYPTIVSLSSFLLEEYQEFILYYYRESITTKKDIEISHKKDLSPVLLRNSKFRFISEDKENKTGSVAISSEMHEPIAVVGMNCRFPGSEDLVSFWNNIENNTDLITRVTEERLSLESTGEASVNKATRPETLEWGGYLTDIDKFDPLFFNISPREAELMDPQQRITMESVWHALENGGIAPGSLKGSKTGVFIGVSGTDYSSLSNKSAINLYQEAQYSMGIAHTMIANRISYYLDLQGPSEPIDTACSSALIAIHRAVENIRSGACSMAIAGGVNTILNSGITQSFAKAGMLSSDGRCKTFDQQANGYVRGEGVGIVILKSLKQAELDGDRIQGVILNTGENHGGRANTLTSPNPKAQHDLLLKTYREAKIDPRSVNYIEAHGTGTKLGDPIEVEALKSSFEALYSDYGVDSGSVVPHIGLGSVKTNIGHLESAAGIAGFIKVILSMKHKKIPGNVHLKEPNKYLQLEESPFYLQQQTKEWIVASEKPRVAGVSSFGFGGSNAHLVVEEYSSKKKKAYTKDVPAVIVLSARNKERLTAQVVNLKTYLDSVSHDLNLHDIAYTLQVGREAMEERLAFVVTSLEELTTRLENYKAGELSAVYTGNISNGKNHFVLKGNAGKGYIEIAVRDKELDSLSQLWAEGIKIDWDLLYLGDDYPNRISLPTYPFAKDRYWIPEQQEGVVLSVKNHLHPLLHINNSDLKEQKYKSTYTGEESFLRDHQVHSEKFLPGVAYLELAREAGVQSIHKPITQLKDITWLSPVRVNGSPQEVQISLFEEGDLVGYELYSGSPDSGVIHSQGRLASEKLGAVPSFSITEIQSRLDEEKQGIICYQLFKEIGLDYGSSFQGIEKLYYSTTESLSKIHLDLEEGYVLPPGLLDSALQTCIGMSLGDQKKVLSLPFSVKEVNIYGAVEDTAWCYVCKRSAHNSASTIGSYDIYMLSKSGDVLLSFIELTILPLKEFDPSTSISGKDSQKASMPILENSNRCYKPVWERSIMLEKESISETASGVTVIIGQKNTFTDQLEQKLKSLGAEVIVIEEFGLLSDLERIDSVYLLQGLDQDIKSSAKIIDQIDSQELSVFRSIKKLQSKDLRALQLTVVSFKTQLVCTTDTVNSAGSGIIGFVSSLAKEEPNWSIRIIDIDEKEIAGIGDILRVPFSKATQVSVQALRKKVCYRSKLISVEVSSSLLKSKFRNSGVYLILGGAGGLGSVTTEYLIKKYKSKVYWLGRREKNQEIEDLVQTFSKYGSIPEYIQCDATDESSILSAYDQIKLKENTIHGVFHSAMVLHDMMISNMKVSDFKASFMPKSISSHYLVETFKKEPLDFICFYSSIESYQNAFGQSNYSAGCTYKDSYAREVEQELKIPSYTMNWGYWGEVGIVSDESYNDYMSQIGVGSITSEEGMEALETLLSGRGRQLSIIKLVQDNSRTSLPINEDRIIFNQKESSYIEFDKQTTPIRFTVPEGENTFKDVCYMGVLQVLNTLGVENYTKIKLPELRRELGVIDKYERLFTELIRMLDMGGYISLEGESIRISEKEKQRLHTFDIQKEMNVVVATYPDYKAYSELLKVCLQSFVSILKGVTKAIDIIFPMGNIDLASAIYKNNYQADYFNNIICDIVKSSIENSIKNSGQGKKITILEVGAGTGGTSALLFSTLQKYKEHIRYIYTDISKSFLLYAENTYKGVAPYLETKLFNIEMTPEDQEVDLGSCDLVIATNVVHATKDISDALCNIKGVLKENGLILLNEIAKTEIFSTLTFGLLDGWWLYDDKEYRLEGSPGLSSNSWRHVLEHLGYYNVMISPEQQNLPQQIIVAASDGEVILEKAKNQYFKEFAEKNNEHNFLINDEIQERAETYLKDIFNRVLKLKKESIDVEASFHVMGVDSLLVGVLSKELSKDLEYISPTLFFEYRNIRELAVYLAEEHNNFLVDTLKESKKEKAVYEKDYTSPVLQKTRGHRLKGSSFKTFSETERTKIKGQHNVIQDDIAIIGISGRYPGAKNVNEFWENLKGGKDCITEIPVGRWDASAYYDVKKGESGKMNSKWGGFIEGVDQFDPLFFNISPREAELMDPQERLFLQTTWEAIEDAGYTKEKLSYYSTDAKIKTGVYAGVMYNEYQLFGVEGYLKESILAVGASPSSIANRVSYVCDFNGPSMAVDTMCSSSLTAIHLACKDLRDGEANVAIAGGVNVSIHPNKYLLLSQNTFLSERGLCESFGEGGEGFVPSEGVGAVVLKPLSQAEADGDQIYGVIKGSSLNHGGKTNGYTVPNPNAQAAVIKEAIDRAGVKSEDFSYIEAHGTGTSLGDPIEISGLSKAFKSSNKGGQYCAIGSVKSNIGHAESAAGISGLTKILLQFKHKQLVPSLHSSSLNKNIDFERTPFKVQQTLEEWSVEDNKPRLAGISSFGAGGSNAHLVVEEYSSKKKKAYTKDVPAVIVLSARNKERLTAQVVNLKTYLDSVSHDLNLHDIAYTLQVGREAMEERLAFVVTSLEELTTRLENYKAGELSAVYTGNISNGKNHFVLKGNAGKGYIEIAVRDKELDSLSQLWAEGIKIDWDLLYLGDDYPNRISLPTYPFAKDRYWIPEQQEGVVLSVKNHLHPLLHINNSDLKEQKYKSTYTGEESFLRDHQVHSEKFLPGVAYLELAREAGVQSIHKPITQLKDITWLSPVRVNGSPQEVQISLFEEGDLVGYELYSGSPDSGVIHSQGRLASEKLGAVPSFSITEIQSRLDEEKQGIICYQLFKEIGLDYGSSFQGIEKLYYSTTESLSKIHLDLEEGYVLPPGLLDSALQTCIGMSLGDQKKVLSLPFSVKEVNIYGAVEDTAWCYVCKRSAHNSASTIGSYDIYMLSKSGDVLLSFIELETISLDGFSEQEQASVDIALKEELGLHLYKNQWVTQSENAIKDRLDTSHLILLAGGSIALADSLRSSLVLEVISLKEGSALSYYNEVLSIVQDRLELKEAISVTVLYANEDYISYGFISGLLKTASIENSRFTGKTLGVPSLSISAIDVLVSIIEQEVSDSSAEVRYISGTREVLEISDVLDTIDETPTHLQIKEGGVYLITGGMGGLGQLFANYISQTSATRLILTGRSMTSRLSEEALHNLNAVYHSCDVTDQDSVSLLIKDVLDKYGHLDGIIHSAGIIKDELIKNKTPEDASLVLSPKISGVQYLDEATDNLNLDFMVYFSSIAGVLGNVGQCDYASANAWLDQYASYRNDLVHKGKRKGHTLSINWPLWEEGSMHIQADSRTYIEKKQGMFALPTTIGIEVFEKLLAHHYDQGIVVYGKKSLLDQIFLKKSVKIKQSDNKISKIIGQEKLRETATAYLKTVLSSVLKLPITRIKITDDFEKYGVDSIMAVKLTSYLDDFFENLPSTLFFEYQNLDDLITFFVSEYPDRLLEVTGLSLDTEGKPAYDFSNVVSKNRVSRRYRLSPDVQQGIQSSDSVKFEDIAIIGLSGRYPGASSLEDFWSNLRNGVDSITEIPLERWDLDNFYDPDKDETGKSYSKWGGFIEDVDKFDPLFFNISPREAKFIDPQERLFLQTVWESLEDSGYTRESLQQIQSSENSITGGHVGVYAGVMYNEYQLFGVEETLKGNPLATFSSPSSIANRVSYYLNLHGPSMAVDTMCSSSLTAIHLAVDALHNGHCSMAIAGGVNVSVHPNKYKILSQNMFVSDKGRCESFGEGGEGYVPSEGVGAVVLKPLSQAETDGDQIYGVIKGSSLNHGGKTNGYTVPNPNAQAAVIREAIDRAGVKLEDFSYIEAHGTGTSLGDPIEISGLSKAFKSSNKTGQYCAIGSVKSNIGHAESAAGISGLTKVLLQFKHKQLVPSLHSSSLNKNIDFERTPFKVQQTLEEWSVEDNKPRLAGISSFGAGGGNAHLIVKEYQRTVSDADIDSKIQSPYVFVVSARNVDRLIVLVENLRLYLESQDSVTLSSVAYTLQIGRESMQERLSFVASSKDSLLEKLGSYLSGSMSGLYTGSTRDDSSGDLVEDTIDKNFLTAAIANKELSDLARLWASGISIDWNLLYDSVIPSKVSLPTYPFAKKRCWISSSDKVLYESNQNRLESKQESFIVPETTETNNIISGSGKIILEELVNVNEKGNNDTIHIEQKQLQELQLEERRVPDLNFENNTILTKNQVTNRTKILFEKVLYLSPEDVDVFKSFMDYGIDSIIGVELIKKINDEFKLNIAASKLYEFTNLNTFINYVLDQLEVQEEENNNTINKDSLLTKTEKSNLLSNDEDSTTLMSLTNSIDDDQIESKLRILFQEVLFLDEPEVDMFKSFQEYGIDSILGVELIKQVNNEFGLDIAASKLYEYNNLDELKNYLKNKLIISSQDHKKSENVGVSKIGLVSLNESKSSIKQQVEITENHQDTAQGNVIDTLNHVINSIEDDQIESKLKILFQEVLFLDEPEVDVFKSFQEYGIDSILGVELVKQINNEFDLDIAASKLYGYNNLDELKKYLKNKLIISPKDHKNPENIGVSKIELVSLNESKSSIEQQVEITENHQDTAHGNVIDTLKKQFQQLLYLEDSEIDITDSFEHYGLDELITTNWINTIYDDFTIRVSIEELYNSDTLKNLASLIQNKSEMRLGNDSIKVNNVSTVPQPVGKRKKNQSEESNLKEDSIVIVAAEGVFYEVNDSNELWEKMLQDQNIKTQKEPTEQFGRLDTTSLGENISVLGLSKEAFGKLNDQQKLIYSVLADAFVKNEVSVQEMSSAPTGIFIGAQQVLSKNNEKEFAGFEETATYLIPNKISFLLNLKGPSEVVNSYCSSSYVAIHKAIQNIELGECNQAIVGAVNIVFDNVFGKEDPKMQRLFSNNGLTQSFCDDASGFVRSEGAGIIIMKRLKKAIKDGNKVLAVLKGSSVSHNGRGFSLEAPSAEGIKRVVKKSLQKSKIAPETIDYIEAHGIANKMADAIELTAISEVYNELITDDHTKKWQVSTIKPVVGHPEFASGMASLIKVIKAFENKMIPGIVGLGKVNSELANNQYITLTQESRYWKNGNHPRRAALNSYTVGGVNAHIILEEYTTKNNSSDIQQPEETNDVSTLKNEQVKLTPQYKSLISSVSKQVFKKDFFEFDPYEPLFNLGLSSVEVIQFTQNLNEVLDIDIPVGQVFGKENLNEVLKLFKANVHPKDVEPDRHLLLLSDGLIEKASFIIPGMPGISDGYFELAKEISEDNIVYGLQMKGVYGDTPLNSITKMASHNIELIEKSGAQGEISLYAHSFGGSVVLEMMKKLKKNKNIKVDKIVFIDTPDLSGKRGITKKMTLLFIDMISDFSGLPKEKYENEFLKLLKLPKRDWESNLKKLFTKEKHSKKVEIFMNLWSILVASLDAKVTYNYIDKKTPIYIVTASDTNHKIFKLKDWQEHFKNANHIVADGDHFSIIKKPFVKEWIQKI